MTQVEQNTWNLDETLGTRWYERGNYAPNTNSGPNTNVLGSLNNSMTSQNTVPASQNNMAPAAPATPASPSPFKRPVNGYTPRYLEEKEEEEEEEARPIRGRMPYRNYSAGLRNIDRSRSRSRGTWPNDNSRPPHRHRGGYRRKSKRHTKKNTKRNRKTNRKSHH